MRVVSDSSPLILFARIGSLDVLERTFGEIVVPSEVWEEVVGARAAAPGVTALRSATWIQVDDRSPQPIDLGLDPGETAAIALAETIGADLLLIDERAGRAVAQARGLRVRGTLGVLVQARLAGSIPALRPRLDSLSAEGFRLAPALVQEALRRVGEV